MLLPKAPVSRAKKTLKYFSLHCTSICMSSKSELKLEILMFLTFAVSFSVDMFN